VTRPQLRKALHSLPKDLDGTYERILCNIKDSNVAYALKILQWLTYSARPLALEEIAEVIAIDVHDDPRFDPERRLAAPQDVMTICSSLITIDGEEILDYGLQDRYTPVRLAHFSVKEYLVSDRIRIGKASGYSIRERESIAVIAEDCLAYLLYFDVANVFTPLTVDEPTDWSFRSESLTPEHQSEFPLALYAARFWMQHAQTAEASGTTKTSSLIVELLRSRGAAFENMMRLWISITFYSDLKSNRDFDRPLLLQKFRSPLHFVSLFGLVNSVKMLLEQGYHADAKVQTSAGDFSALCAACIGGYALIVKILLDKGAVVDLSEGSEDRSPLYHALYHASYFGHEEVVRLLLGSGANASAQGGEFFTALQAASFIGQGKIVQLLLDNDADSNAQGGYYGNALQAASYRGYKEVVQLLIENGADVNAQGGEHGNALQAASYECSMEIVQLLIKKGADVNAQGGYYGNALQAASYQGYKEVVQLLIENGADVNAQGGIFENALQAASYSGYKEVVQLLIENDADVNAQGGILGNALQAASYRGRKEVVQLLIEKGPDVNIQGGRYGNALQAASYEGLMEIVQLLIENGADANAQGGEYGNALHAASFMGRKEVVQLLIEKGADVNARDGFHRTALHAATERDDWDVVQLLRDSGAIELDGTSQSEDGSDESPVLSEEGSDWSEYQSEDDLDEIGHQSEKDSAEIENQSEEDPDALQQGGSV